MKLKKLSEDHYIIMDDSEPEIGDWVYSMDGIHQWFGQVLKTEPLPKKITHSTNIDWNEVYYIPLSEVKELLGVVDVEKKAFELAILFHNTYEKLAPAFGYETRLDTKVFDKNSANGKLMIAVCKEIYQALEDNKDKKYTEEDLRKAISETRRGMLFLDKYVNEFIQSLQPKAEWEVEYVDGKLKLVNT